MMTLTKAKESKSTHFADYKRLRFYMRQEAYWQGMFEEASFLIAKLEVEGPQLPNSFESFFKSSRKNHVAEAFCHLLGIMKSAADCASLPEIVHSSK